MHFQTAAAVSLYERAIRLDPAFIAVRRHYVAAAGDLIGSDEALRRIKQLPPPPQPIADVAEQAASLIAKRALQLERAGDVRGAEVLLTSTAGLLPHPRDRIWVLSELTQLLKRSGQRARYQHYMRAIEAAVAREAGAAARYHYLLNHLPAAVGGIDSLALAAAELACRHHAYAMCASAYSSVASYHLNNGNPVSAIDFAQRALAVAQRSGSAYYISLAQMKLGRAYLRSGQYARAEPVLKAAIRSAQSAHSTYLHAEALHNLAHTYESAGRWAEARQTAQRFVATAELLTDPLEVISLRDAGLIYWDSGQRAAARDFFKRMIALIDERDTDHVWAGEYYEREGDLRQAHRYYRRALRWTGDTARITSGLVRVYLALEERDSAEAAARMHDRASQTPEEVPLMPQVLAARGELDRAVQIAEAWAQRKEKEQNLIGAANAWLQVGELMLQKGRLREADAAGSKVLAFATALNVLEPRSRALLLQGNAQHRMHQPGAVRTLERAVAAARGTGVARLHAHALTDLAEVQAANHSWREGLQAADSALRIYDSMAERFTDDFDRARFAAQRARPFQTGVRILQQQNDGVRMVSWLQRHKMRVTSATRALPAAELQRTLSPDEVLIDYAVLDSAVVALIVTNRRLQIVELALSREALTALVARLRSTTVSHLGRIDWARATFDYQAAYSVYQQVVLPLAPFMAGRSRLVIVPDDALHFVPFDALVAEPRARRFLVDTHEVTYLSTSAHAGFQRTGRYGSIGVVHIDAPATRTEALMMQTEFRAVSLVPTEAAMARALRAHDVVHVATHAEANLQQPLSSFLKLQPGAGEDGYFHITEIAATPTAARLVFLSACETQHGRVFTGVGIMGVAQAFLDAGAQSVVATQWPVGASAVSMAKVFYLRLEAGDGPAAALRAAKLAMRADPRTSDPLHWGPFMLVTSHTKR